MKVQENKRCLNQEKFKAILDEAAKLRYKKYCCYGDCYKDFGLLGIAIKINDKNSRMKNLIKDDCIDNHGETLRDTAIDMLNYCAMFVMTLDEVKNDTD